jgi:hypothetical protein
MPHKPKLFIKIGIALVCAALALVVPLHFTASEQAVVIVKHFAYWMLGATSLLFLLYLRESLKEVALRDLIAKAKAHLPALILILVAALYLHLHVDRGFKILFDEHAISSTAMSMHYDNRAFVQAASHIVNDEVIASIGFVDKRPAFFPFVVSLVHSISGYRPENVFWLNSGLTVLLLGLIYVIAARTCGKPHGMLAVLLMTSLPLLAQNTNGGGYEIMNLCLICGMVLAGLNYMRKEGSQGLDLLLLTAILLANNRYESIAYVVVPALLFLLKSYREKKLSLTWFAVFSPLLLMTPLFSYAVFQGDDRFIQTDSANFFSGSHLSGNVAHALTYLFETSGDYSNSVLLSATGMIAGLFLAVQLIRRAPFFLKQDNGLTVPFVVFLVVAFNTTLALSCYWGAWTDPSTSRFSFPLQLFFVLSVPLVLHYDFRLKHLPKWMPITCLLFIIGISSPHAERLNNETRMSASEGYDWALNWARDNTKGENNLYLAESVLGFGLNRQASLPFMVANAMPERVVLPKEWGIYDEIYTLEVLYHDTTGNEGTPSRYTALNQRFVLQSVAQKSIDINLFYRISRVVGLNEAEPGNETTPANLPPQRTEGQRFSEYFYKSLPLIPKEDNVTK